MAEEGEDVKPKIDLTINYDAQGQSQHFLSLTYAHCGNLICRVNGLSLAACTVKVKSTTPLKKVFEAAEVCARGSLNETAR